MKLKQIITFFTKLGIIFLGYFMGPSPFCKDLRGGCAKAVAMNKFKEFQTKNINAQINWDKANREFAFELEVGTDYSKQGCHKCNSSSIRPAKSCQS